MNSMLFLVEAQPHNVFLVVVVVNILFQTKKTTLILYINKAVGIKHKHSMEGDDMSEDNLRVSVKALMVGEKDWTALLNRSVPTLLLCVLTATLGRIWPTDSD